MQEKQEKFSQEISAAELQLRPLVVIVVAAKLAVTALLLTNVQLFPPAPPQQIGALR